MADSELDWGSRTPRHSVAWHVHVFVQDEWATQCIWFAEWSPEMKLGQALRDWFEERRGPAGQWRLQVRPNADDTRVLAGVELQFEVRRIQVERSKRPPIDMTTR